MAATEEDWKAAETLATEHLETTRNVSDPITFRRFVATPFLLGAWWSNGGATVLVFDGKVQEPRGIADLPAYLTFLGEARTRALDVEFLDNLLEVFKAARPADDSAGIPWTVSSSYPELHPTISQSSALVKYVGHYVERRPALPLGLRGGPPAPGGPLVLQRWSLQLFPVVSSLEWKFEGRVEKPRPPAP
jgi:hypothetical protein